MNAARLLAGFILFPGISSAQDPRLVVRLEPGVREAVIAFVDSSRADGLPSEPLVQKALEGASKGAPGPRILSALRSLAENLRIARTALGTASTEQELVAGAAAIRAGATIESIRTLRQANSARDLSVPLAVLADLVTLGVGMERAHRSVLDLAKTEARDEDFIRLKQRLDPERRP